jgi:two-component system chemotaxis response regulator CheB
LEKKIRVVVIDDSSFMRKKIAEILHEDSEIEVVGQGKNGQDGLEKIKSLKPDVITLDIDMPVMDGLTAIKHIMIKYPVPIVVLSSMTDNGNVTFNCLRLGVADFIAKPSGAISEDIASQKAHIIKRVKRAAGFTLANTRRVRVKSGKNGGHLHTLPEKVTDCIVAIGATMGENNSAIRILSQLPCDLPAIVMVMLDVSSSIIPSFIDRFTEFCSMQVHLLAESMELIKGHAYITSTAKPVLMFRSTQEQVVVNIEKPIEHPLDSLFSVAVDIFGHNVLAVLLTRTCEDGLRGLVNIKRNHGEIIIYQDATRPLKQGDCRLIEEEALNITLNDQTIAKRVCEVVNSIVKV